MRNLTEQNVSEAVLAQLGNTPDPRLKEIVTRLIEHLHAFAREVELKDEEWFAATEFLTEVGKQEEFILLSDVLGLSILVDALSHRKAPGATESSVLGPFYRERARLMQPPVDVAGATAGESVLFSGRVTDPSGGPIPGALLDVWQTAPNGRYENEDDGQPEMNLRGRFRTDAEGGYSFRTVKPVSYGIAGTGPVGRLLKSLGRHNFRPAHIHFKVSAEGYEPLTTMIFVEGDAYLDSDPVFGVKNSLVADFERHDDAAEIDGHRLEPPYYTARYDFGLEPAG
ncbi:MAG: dioxygenase [bacterium]